MKLLLISLTLFVLITSSYLDSIDAHASAFCQGKCKVRCSKAGQRARCMKYCLLCCEECKCVPSGTYGHKDECPCYRDKVAKGHKRKPKCP